MESNLKRGLILVFSANIVNLVFNLLTNFLMPKYLSVDSYAAIKTFQLYTTYIGIFGLGAADGMYLRYGGKQLQKIDRCKLRTGLYSFRILMLLESVILFPLSFLLKDKIIIAFTLTIMSTNITNYFKNLYQAVGEFKKYGKILNWTTIATFAINMILLFIVDTDDYFLFLLGYVLVNAVIWIVLEYNIHNLFENDNVEKVLFSLRLLINDIKSGILLMIGNFSNILLSSMDRWFVKIMMDTVQFAYYSFAVSLEGFLNVAITPITTTMYNYFCTHLKPNDIIRVRRYVLLFGTIIIAAAYPAKFIIELFLKNYIGSVSVMFILFSTQVLYVMIKGVYINLYKAVKKQNTYFFRLMLILIIGAALNYIFVRIYPYKEAFAVGTLVSAFIWLLLCIFDFKEYEFKIREWVYIISEILIFIISGVLLNSVIGFIVYVLFTLLMMRVFMHDEGKELIRIVKSMINR